MDFDKICPKLFLGSCPRVAADIDELTSAGITAVLNLQTDADFERRGIDWNALERHYGASGIEVQRCSVVDYDDGNLQSMLPAAARMLKELVQREHVVYVHCSAGINRSPSVVIYYLHREENMELSEAESHVMRCRCCAPIMCAIRGAIERPQGGR